jgi:hypothetical protein
LQIGERAPERYALGAFLLIKMDKPVGGVDVGKGRRNNYESLVRPKLALVEKWTREGLTQDQIAKNLGVGVSSFRAYINQHSELLEAINKGRIIAVAEVENALFKRALGYDYEEVKRYNKRDDGGNVTEYVEKTTKHLPPDVAACFILLKNKDRGNWADNPMKIDLDREMAEWRKELEEKKSFF